MTGDKHVGKGQQPRENIVGDELVGQILEEQIRLFLVDIEAETADLPRSSDPGSRRGYRRPRPG